MAVQWPTRPRSDSGYALPIEKEISYSWIHFSSSADGASSGRDLVRDATLREASWPGCSTLSVLCLRTLKGSASCLH